MRFPTIALTALALTSAAKGLSRDAAACAKEAGQVLYQQQGHTYRNCMDNFPDKGFLNSVGDVYCSGKTLLSADKTKFEEVVDQSPACQRYNQEIAVKNWKRKNSPEPEFSEVLDRFCQDANDSILFVREAHKGFHEQRTSPLQRLKDKSTDVLRDLTKKEL